MLTSASGRFFAFRRMTLINRSVTPSPCGRDRGCARQKLTSIPFGSTVIGCAPLNGRTSPATRWLTAEKRARHAGVPRAALTTRARSRVRGTTE